MNDKSEQLEQVLLTLTDTLKYVNEECPYAEIGDVLLSVILDDAIERVNVLMYEKYLTHLV